MRKNLKTTFFCLAIGRQEHNASLEGDSWKKLTIPETPSERPLEHSEIANSKNSFFYSDVHTKNKSNANPKQSKNLDPRLNFHKSDTESENSCQDIKNTTIQESVVKREWDNTKIPEVSEQNPKNWHIE